MFDNENEEEWLTPDFKEQLASFEKMYASKQYKYMDSEHIEFILDHLIVTSQMPKARWAAEMALGHFPTNTHIQTKYAQILSSIGEITAALLILLELERIEPYNTEVLITIAACYSQLKNSKEAIKYYNKAMRFTQGEEKIDITLDLAMEYENINEYPAAIKILENAIKEGNINDLIVYELAHCYEKNKDYNKAVQCFKDYIDIEPYSYTTWYNLGNVYAKQQKYEEAIWAYDYAIIINDKFIPALYNIANTYFDNDQIEESLAYFNKCLELDKDDPLVYCSIGECYEELGEIEMAYDMFHKSTELFPQFSEAWLGKGIMSDILGFSTRAIIELKVAIDLAPEKAENWNALANAFDAIDDDEAALNAFEKAVALAPNDNEIIVDYLAFLTKLSIDHVLAAIENTHIIQNNSLVQLVLTYSYWSIGEALKSQLIFENLIQEDIELAKELFFYFPELENEDYYKDRLNQL